MITPAWVAKCAELMSACEVGLVDDEGAEIVGPGYRRQPAIAFQAKNMLVTNKGRVMFPRARGDWPQHMGAGLFDGDVLLRAFPSNKPRRVMEDEQIIYDPGDLVVEFEGK